MSNYLDILMKNYPLQLTDSDSNNVQTGGRQSRSNDVDFPSGGFPPIYICEVGETMNNEEKKERREYTTNKTAVSIKQIMEKRRKITPFVSV